MGGFGEPGVVRGTEPLMGGGVVGGSVEPVVGKRVEPVISWPTDSSKS